MAAVTNFEKLIAVYIKQLQDLEQVYFQLINERGVDTAVGAQLDILGTIVGEERFGRNDDDYRVAIKGRIRLNLSNGTIEDIIEVVRLQIGDVPLVLTEDAFPAHFELLVPDPVAVLGASVTSKGMQTYALAQDDDLLVEIDGAAAQTVTFGAASFADIAAATAAEVAAAINLTLGGANAVPNNGQVLLRSDTLGDVSSLRVVGGIANAVLSFDLGNLSLATTLSGVAETSVIVSAAIPVTAPLSGTLSIERDSGAYIQVAYTSFTGSTFTIPATDFSLDNATTPKIVVVAIEHTGEEANQALMIRISNVVQQAKGGGIRGILLWNTCAESFGFLGTTGALGFDEGCFASALDV